MTHETNPTECGAPDCQTAASARELRPGRRRPDPGRRAGLSPGLCGGRPAVLIPTTYVRRVTRSSARLAGEPDATDPRARGRSLRHGHAGRRAGACPIGISSLHQLSFRGRLWDGHFGERPGGEGAGARGSTEHLIPGPWQEIRQPNAQELKRAVLLAIPIDGASARSRGPPIDDEEDYQLGVWAGVVPLRMTASEPVPDPKLARRLCRRGMPWRMMGLDD